MLSQKLKLIHHASIHSVDFGEFSFSPAYGQISRSDAFCRCGCLPWTWLARIVCLGSVMVNGSTRWVMYQGVVHLDAETRAAELHWLFLFLVNLAPLFGQRNKRNINNKKTHHHHHHQHHHHNHNPSPHLISIQVVLSDFPPTISFGGTLLGIKGLTVLL